MPDHLHLLVEATSDSSDLPRFVQRAKQCRRITQPVSIPDASGKPATTSAPSDEMKTRARIRVTSSRTRVCRHRREPRRLSPFMVRTRVGPYGRACRDRSRWRSDVPGQVRAMAERSDVATLAVNLEKSARIQNAMRIESGFTRFISAISSGESSMEVRRLGEADAMSPLIEPSSATTPSNRARSASCARALLVGSPRRP